MGGGGGFVLNKVRFYRVSAQQVSSAGGRHQENKATAPLFSIYLRIWGREGSVLSGHFEENRQNIF